MQFNYLFDLVKRHIKKRERCWFESRVNRSAAAERSLSKERSRPSKTDGKIKQQLGNRNRQYFTDYSYRLHLFEQSEGLGGSLKI